MRNTRTALFGVCSAWAFTASTVVFAAPVDRTPAAKRLVSQLAKGDYGAVEKSFDATMSKALPQDKLKQTWDTITAQIGKLKSEGAAKQQKAQGYDIVLVACTFEKAAVDARIAYNSAGKVSGLFFVPHTAPPAPQPRKK